MRQGVLQRSPAPASVPRGSASAPWSTGFTEQAQALSGTIDGDEQRLLDSSSSLVPLHVNSIKAALAQPTQPTAALHGVHGTWMPDQRERWHSMPRHTPPLQALPDGRPELHAHVSAATEATEVAVARRRASLNIALPADERALRTVATQNSGMSHADYTAEADWSRLDHSQERWRDDMHLGNHCSEADWSRESGRRSAGMSHQHGAQWAGLGSENSGEDGRMSMMQPRPDSGAAEKLLRQAKDEAAARAAEVLRLRASHTDLQSQLEARHSDHPVCQATRGAWLSNQPVAWACSPASQSIRATGERCEDH